MIVLRNDGPDVPQRPLSEAGNQLLKQRTWDLIAELNRHVASGLITKEALVLIGAVQQLLPEQRPDVGPMRVPIDADTHDMDGLLLPPGEKP
jgi:hypothetical protein